MATVAVAKKGDGGGGARISDLMAPPDLSAVGNSARASKKTSATPQELSSFSVKKGDNGGVIVSEIYERKAPEGRRPASFMLGGGDVKENPFSAKDGAAASAHITDLLSQMGVQGAEPPSAPEPTGDEGPGLPPLPPPPPPARPPAAAMAGPSVGAVRGPMGGGAARMSGGGGMLRGPGY